MTYEPARSLTPSELALLRSNGQSSKIRVVIIPQQTVFACKCSGSLASNDKVVNVPIDSFTAGSITKVTNGMTAYVGSGSGLSDLGMVRVKSASGSTLHIGIVSGIPWSSSVHITVVDDYGLWEKPPSFDLSKIKMDSEITYTNQNTKMSPVPILGPDMAVPYSSGSIMLDATNSYCLDGSNIASYSWTVRSGSASMTGIVSPSSGSTPFVFPAPGSYHIHCVVTSGNGVSTTGHRTVYVYGTGYEPLDQISDFSMNGDRESGEWSADITMWADATLTTVRDRAKVIVLADDVYSGSAAVSIGQVSGAEKTLMVGWISGESIKYDREKSTVKFTVKNAAWWLKQITGPSTFLESVTTTPKAWTSIMNMTWDMIVHHFLYWRSTAIEIMDVYRSNNPRIIGGMSCSIGSIYDQLNDTATTRLLSFIVVDRYGRLFTYINPQLISLSDRSSIPVVQVVSDDDVTEQVDLNRTIVSPIALLEVAGLAPPPAGKTELQMFMSRAPGSLIYGRFGANDINDRLIVSSQTDANMLAGLLLAYKNNEYPSTHIVLGQNNRMIDIGPAMYIELSANAVQNARGISYTNMRFLPKKVSYKVNQETGAVTVDIDAEGETYGLPGYKVTVPQEPIYNIPVPVPTIPDPPIIPVPPNPYIPPSPITPSPTPPDGACRSGADTSANGPYEMFLPSPVLSTQKYGQQQYFLGYLRPNTATNPSSYRIEGFFGKLGTYSSGSIQQPPDYEEDLTDDWYDVVVFDKAGNYVATGVHDPVTDPNVRTGKFNNAAGADFTHVGIIIKPFEIMNLNWPADGSFWGNSIGVTAGLTFYEESKSYGYKNDGSIYFKDEVMCTNAVYGGVYPNAPTFQFNVPVSGSGLTNSVVHIQVRLGDPYPSWVTASTVIGIGTITYGPSNLSYRLSGSACYQSAETHGSITYAYDLVFKGDISSGIRFAVFMYDGGGTGVKAYKCKVYMAINFLPSHIIRVSSFSLSNICENSEVIS